MPRSRDLRTWPPLATGRSGEERLPGPGTLWRGPSLPRAICRRLPSIPANNPQLPSDDRVGELSPPRSKGLAVSPSTACLSKCGDNNSQPPPGLRVLERFPPEQEKALRSSDLSACFVRRAPTTPGDSALPIRNHHAPLPRVPESSSSGRQAEFQGPIVSEAATIFRSTPAQSPGRAEKEPQGRGCPRLKITRSGFLTPASNVTTRLSEDSPLLRPYLRSTWPELPGSAGFLPLTSSETWFAPSWTRLADIKLETLRDLRYREPPCPG